MGCSQGTHLFSRTLDRPDRFYVVQERRCPQELVEFSTNTVLHVIVHGKDYKCFILFFPFVETTINHSSRSVSVLLELYSVQSSLSFDMDWLKIVLRRIGVRGPSQFLQGYSETQQGNEENIWKTLPNCVVYYKL